MEKIASDAALEDAAHRLSQRNGELEVVKKQNQHLQMQLQSIQQIRNTVHRLQQSSNVQWKAMSDRDQTAMQRLQKEQEYFRLRQSESVPQIRRGSPVRGRGGGRVEGNKRGAEGTNRRNPNNNGKRRGADSAVGGGYGYAAQGRRR